MAVTVGAVKLNAPQSCPITILVVDDHELLRSLLVEALQAVAHFAVVGQAGDAESGVELCRSLRPAVVILDSVLPGRQGPDAVEAMLQASPRSRVLMVSGMTNPLAVRRALAGGARGFLSKSAPLTEMIEGVRSVHAGHVFCGAGSRRLVQAIMEDLPAGGQDSPLSGRERDVLSGIALGLSSKEIAGRLGLSVFTIENHRRRIMDRTGVHSIAGLTLLAVELGLINAPPRCEPGCDCERMESRRSA